MGIDPRGILRAVYSNVTGRTISEGGSTITQQLAKNAYLTQDRTLKRKVQEIFLALQIERQYTKQEILELYLNQIYFGQGAYGVQAATQTYFGKNVEDLDLNECALLAGIPKSPNYYSPFDNARLNLEKEQPFGTTFDKLRAEARKRWNDDLARIRIKGGTEEQKRIFYTALYHTLLHPNILQDVSEQYPQMEGDKILTTHRNRYTVFSLWDTYRNVH